MSYAWAMWAWALSGLLHLVVGGYITYRFRKQIDAARAYLEPGAAYLWDKVGDGIAHVYHKVMSKV